MSELKNVAKKYYYSAVVVIRKKKIEDNTVVSSFSLRPNEYSQDKKPCTCTVCKKQTRAVFKVRRMLNYFNICLACVANLVIPGDKMEVKKNE